MGHVLLHKLLCKNKFIGHKFTHLLSGTLISIGHDKVHDLFYGFL